VSAASESEVLDAGGPQSPASPPAPLRSPFRFHLRADAATADRRAPAALPLAPGHPHERALVREGLHRRALIVADALAALLATTIALAVAGVAPGPLAIVAVPIIVFINKAAGLYDREELLLHKTTLGEVPALVQLSAVFTLITWLGNEGLAVTDLVAREVLLLWAGVLGLLIAGRVAARALARRFATVERCLLVGSSRDIRVVATKLAGSRAKATVVATVDLVPGGSRIDARTVGELLEFHRVDRVIVAPLDSDHAELMDLIRVAQASGRRVTMVPRLFEVVGSAVAFDEIDGLTLLGVRFAILPRSSRVLKRAFDLFGATLAIVCTAPLMALIALAIRLDSPGPVLFRQVRVGRDGKAFRILKFRSMVARAEELKPQLAYLNEAPGLFKIAADPRITRFGRFLRRSALDELPQLFNVWRGEMSLVGPRPLIVDEDARITGFDRFRLRLTPGMTGPWQVLGSTRIPIQEMLAIDYLYVAGWTLWTDVKLLLRTIPLVLSRRGM
jgi:exopolysaccharide biosynthesis polyprenyl glycosylphosphotransferase